jgi:polyphenol oxidase
MRPQPAAGFDWTETSSGPVLISRPLERFARHLFTTRPWRLGAATQPSLADEIAAGWAEVARALDVEPAQLARVHQVHGASVRVVRRGEPEQPALVDADILVTDDPSRALAIQTADCVPILIADTTAHIVAAAHAGWRGLAARAPHAAVAAMTAHFSSQPRDLIAAIGPSISAARYEVGADVRERFDAAGFPRDRVDAWFSPSTRAGHWLFDGWLSARDQLEASGLCADRIDVARMCTASHPDLFCSYRRDGTRAGRIVAAIRAR